MDCRDLFQQAATSGNCCKEISENKPGCTCEVESVSAYSPGPVAAAETIARLIYAPLHIDSETGETTEMAFSDVNDKGLSVQRMPLASGANVISIGEKKLEKDHARGKVEREFLGIVRVGVGQVRQKAHKDERRTFCVYDTGLSANQAHADVCQEPASPSEMKRARKKLRDLFELKPRMP